MEGLLRKTHFGQIFRLKGPNNLTQIRLSSIRPPRTAEVPVTQEQITGRPPRTAEVPVTQEQITGRPPRTAEVPVTQE